LVPMLEVIIDLNLRLAEFFKEGGPLEERKNPAVKELDISDALGNAKMIKIFTNPKWAHPDPETSIFFRRLAEKFVLFKNTGLISSFMEKKEYGTPVIQDKTQMIGKKITKVSRMKTKTQRSQISSKSRKFWYFKRQQRKSRTRYKKQVITD